MPMTAAQLIVAACDIAKTPGMTVKAGSVLNLILSDLCQAYDFEAARRKFYFNFNPGIRAVVGNSIYGSGPYAMPADFLRIAGPQGGQAFYTIDGVPRPLLGIDLADFDMSVQQAGMQSYPYLIAVDMSPLDAVQQGGTGPEAFVWPPPSGAYPAVISYFCQMPDIVTPEASVTVPWFPNQAYLKTRLAGEMMQVADDDRAASFLGSTPGNNGAGAGDILTRYLKNKDNQSNRGRSVQLDPTRFGRSDWRRLPNTKTIGW